MAWTSVFLRPYPLTLRVATRRLNPPRESRPAASSASLSLLQPSSEEASSELDADASQSSPGSPSSELLEPGGSGMPRGASSRHHLPSPAVMTMTVLVLVSWVPLHRTDAVAGIMGLCSLPSTLSAADLGT